MNVANGKTSTKQSSGQNENMAEKKRSRQSFRRGSLGRWKGQTKIASTSGAMGNSSTVFDKAIDDPDFRLKLLGLAPRNMGKETSEGVQEFIKKVSGFLEKRNPFRERISPTMVTKAKPKDSKNFKKEDTLSQLSSTVTEKNEKNRMKKSRSEQESMIMITTSRDGKSGEFRRRKHLNAMNKPMHSKDRLRRKLRKEEEGGDNYSKLSLLSEAEEKDETEEKTVENEINEFKPKRRPSEIPLIKNRNSLAKPVSLLMRKSLTDIDSITSIDYYRKKQFSPLDEDNTIWEVINPESEKDLTKDNTSIPQVKEKTTENDIKLNRTSKNPNIPLKNEFSSYELKENSSGRISKLKELNIKTSSFTLLKSKCTNALNRLESLHQQNVNIKGRLKDKLDIGTKQLATKGSFNSVISKSSKRNLSSRLSSKGNKPALKNKTKKPDPPKKIKFEEGVKHPERKKFSENWTKIKQEDNRSLRRRKGNPLSLNAAIEKAKEILPKLPIIIQPNVKKEKKENIVDRVKRETKTKYKPVFRGSVVGNSQEAGNKVEMGTIKLKSNKKPVQRPIASRERKISQRPNASKEKKLTRRPNESKEKKLNQRQNASTEKKLNQRQNATGEKKSNQRPNAPAEKKLNQRQSASLERKLNQRSEKKLSLFEKRKQSLDDSNIKSKSLKIDEGLQKSRDEKKCYSNLELQRGGINKKSKNLKLDKEETDAEDDAIRTENKSAEGEIQLYEKSEITSDATIKDANGKEMNTLSWLYVSSKPVEEPEQQKESKFNELSKNVETSKKDSKKTSLPTWEECIVVETPLRKIYKSSTTLKKKPRFKTSTSSIKTIVRKNKMRSDAGERWMMASAAQLSTPMPFQNKVKQDTKLRSGLTRSSNREVKVCSEKKDFFEDVTAVKLRRRNSEPFSFRGFIWKHSDSVGQKGNRASVSSLASSHLRHLNTDELEDFIFWETVPPKMTSCWEMSLYHFKRPWSVLSCSVFKDNRRSSTPGGILENLRNGGVPSVRRSLCENDRTIYSLDNPFDVEPSIAQKNIDIRNWLAALKFPTPASTSSDILSEGNFYNQNSMGNNELYKVQGTPKRRKILRGLKFSEEMAERKTEIPIYKGQNNGESGEIKGLMDLIRRKSGGFVTVEQFLGSERQEQLIRASGYEDEYEKLNCRDNNSNDKCSLEIDLKILREHEIFEYRADDIIDADDLNAGLEGLNDSDQLCGLDEFLRREVCLFHNGINIWKYLFVLSLFLIFYGLLWCSKTTFWSSPHFKLASPELSDVANRFP